VYRYFTKSSPLPTYFTVRSECLPGRGKNYSYATVYSDNKSVRNTVVELLNSAHLTAQQQEHTQNKKKQEQWAAYATQIRYNTDTSLEHNQRS